MNEREDSMKRFEPTLGRLVLAGLAAALLSGSAHAENGRIELNHLCATLTGCLADDAAGYPISITSAVGGSFVLTSELVVPDANTTAIEVETSNVDIDLNGFRIVRAGCENATVSCAPASGTGDGIGVDDFATRRSIRVKNGNVVGMGDYGLFLGPEADVSHVHTRWNRSTGIAVNANSRVHRVRSVENDGAGISVLTGSVVSESAAVGNGGIGIFTATSCQVVRNVAWDNGEYGIRSTTGSVVRHNAVGENDSLGGILAAASTVSGNAVYENVGSAGISASTGSLVESNAVSGTVGGVGLGLGDSGYRGNVLTTHPSGNVSGGVNLGANACDGALCP